MDGADGGHPGSLHVQFMGTFRLIYDGRELSLAKSYTGKAMQLLILLLYSGEAGVSKESIRKAIYPEAGKDAGNCLKALLFRLRQKLAKSGLPGEQHILYEKGGYRLTRHMQGFRDVARFEEAAQMALRAQGEQQIPLLREACLAYGGELLPALMAQPWVAEENARLGNMFDHTAQALYRQQMRRCAYDGAYAIAKRASMLRPTDEQWRCRTIKSLLLQGERQRAFEEYGSAVEIFIHTGGLEGADRFAGKLAVSLESVQRPQGK